MLCKLLLADGWRVVGTTRSSANAADLEAIGVEPVIVDVFDRDALVQATCAAQPAVVVHQLTDLPKTFYPEDMVAARQRNARIREIGTYNLVAASIEAKAKRLVAQSIAFAYAPGLPPYSEDATLDLTNASAVAKLEALVTGCNLEGIVLRYGRLYGPRTWSMVPSGEAPVHVEAAADAARRAVTLGKPGIYNVAEEDGTVDSAKAQNELGWLAGFRA